MWRSEIRFRNRADAGQQLALQLASYSNRQDVLVLGIPRGGVPVAFEVAKSLPAPLDIFLCRKLGVPGQEELAFGSVVEGGRRFIDQHVVGAAHIPVQQIEAIAAAAQAELTRRASRYRQGQAAASVTDRTIILIDDGVATGSSMYAAMLSLRQLHPAKLILAVPVAPPDTCAWLSQQADELVVTRVPSHFHAVGQFYVNFEQTSDDEVVALLREAAGLLAVRSRP